jgi:DNA invertase Pin-like site-specific DNA recombinase
MKEHGMTSNTYAALYVRVSSEAQAEGASPDEQERDCQAVAEQHGLTVLKVYRDVERYRVKGKLVDPSGTRADRPGLVAMLADAAAGQFGKSTGSTSFWRVRPSTRRLHPSKPG